MMAEMSLEESRRYTSSELGELGSLQGQYEDAMTSCNHGLAESISGRMYDIHAKVEDRDNETYKTQLIEFVAANGARDEITDMHIYLRHEGGNYEEVKDVCLDPEKIERRILASEILKLTPGEREGYLYGNYVQKHGEEKLQELVREVSRQRDEIAVVVEMSPDEKLKHYAEVERTLGIQARKTLSMKVKETEIKQAREDREAKQEREKIENLRKARAECVKTAPGQQVKKYLDNIEKEAKAIMRLPTEARKKYYANVSQNRGQRAAEELMWAVKRERFSTKEMER